MKWVLIGGVPAAVAGGIYFHGPLVTGETYAVPAAQVAQTLENLSFPGYVGSTVSGLPGASTTRDIEPGKSVTYFFHARGGQAAKFVASYQPVDATHTRVSTRMEMSGDAEKLLKGQYMSNAKEFEVVGAAAIREQIDARLEARPFNKDVVMKAMQGYAMANMGEIQKGVADALNESIQMQESRASTSRYTPPPGSPDFQAGRPMVDPNPGAAKR
jgi:hypothetical protein